MLGSERLAEAANRIGYEFNRIKNIPNPRVALTSLALAGLVTAAGLIDLKPSASPSLPNKDNHTISLVAPSFNPSQFGSPISIREAHAEDWILLENAPWQTRRWFPLDEGVAANRGIITANGPAGIYDKLHRESFGENSGVQEAFQSLATNYLRRFGGTKEWAGFCHGIAHLMLGPEPSDVPETFVLSNGERVTVTYQDRLGIGALYMSGDLMWRPFLGDGPTSDSTKFVQENLDYFTDRLVEAGETFIVNASEDEQQIGYWYRVVYGVSVGRDRLLVTNLNNPDKPLIAVPARPWIQGRGGVREVYRPVSQKEGKRLGVDPRLYGEIPPEWRFDHLMNEDLVNWILYGPQS